MYYLYAGDTFETAYNWVLDTGRVNTVGLSIRKSAKKDIIKFVPPVTGSYRIYSSNCTGDIYGELYDSQQSMLAYNDDGAGNLNYSITYTLTAGQAYFILTRNYNSAAATTGAYNLNIVVP